MAEVDSDQETAQPSKRRAAKRTTKRAAAKKATATKSAAKKAAAKETSPKKAAAKKTVTKRATKKTAAQKASTKKTGVNHTGTAPATQNKATATASQELQQTQEATGSAFDRSQLVDKIRVHLLAKLMGITSRELTSALRDMGLNKVAQSTLSLEESNAVLDRLEGHSAGADQQKDEAPVEENEKPEKPKKNTKKSRGKSKSATQGKQDKSAKEKKTTKKAAASKKAVQSEEDEEPTQPQDSAADEEALEKLKYRVGKNVENEIHQIEQKVDRELEARQQDQKQAQAEKNHEDLKDADEDGFTDLDEEAFEDSRLAHDRNLDVAEAMADAPIFLAPQDTLNRSGAEQSDRQDSTQDHSHRSAHDGEDSDSSEGSASRRRRRGRRGTRRGRGPEAGRSTGAEQPDSEEHNQFDEQEAPTEPVAIKGSTRLEAQKRRRTEMRQKGRQKRHIVSQAEFLARRESVERIMVVCERQRHDHEGRVTQVGVLEDGVLVEHFVTSEDQSSMIGNIYLGRVQNVLPSMEAAFIDIGTGRNGVLYSGEVDWKSAGLGGRGRRIEQALHPGDQVVVQATKDPLGHKGARLTTQISLPGRYLVYVPGGHSSGISRKLPIPERKRLKEILKHVMPEDGGAIIRTAAEGVSEEAIAGDVDRLRKLWEDINKHSESDQNSQPVTLYEEPNVLVKVIRDLFNEDFNKLIVDGERSWNIVNAYVQSVAPDLVDRLEKWDREEHDGADVFEHHQINEQLHKALSRKVWLPSGGTLIIDRTEAMTVIDVNTGRFTGSGGNLEETVTSTNLEAAEEIVRQLRLRDIGGMVVIDFIDMVLPENRDLVVRRLTESLGRDRTRHQVSEVTSLGLVQLTRKRLGTGLLETFATECEECGGRGVIIHDDPVEDTTRYDKHQHHAKRRPENAAEHPLFQALKQHKKSDEELVDAVLGDLADSPEDSQLASKPAAQSGAKATPKRAEPESRNHEEGADHARPTRRRRATRRNSAHDEQENAHEDEQRSAGERHRDRGRDAKPREERQPRHEHDAESDTTGLEESSSSSKRRGRRRVHRVMSTKGTQEPASKESARDAVEDSRKDEAAESGQPRGRSSRRGVRRAVRRSSARTITDEPREDPAVAEQRYAEEKAAFENSPRRKRRVRGNSKSDVPPEPPRSRRR